MKRILIAVLAAVMMISAVTGFTVLNGRVKETMVPVAYAIPLHTSVPLPSASSNLVSAAGSGLTSGAALCAALTPAAPDAMEAAAATVTRLEAEAKAKAEAEAKAKAEAEAKAKAAAEAKAKAAAQLTAAASSGTTLGDGVINASDVRLRSDANTSSSILATLSKGTAVTVLTQSGSWYAVSYNGTNGYVSQQYVTLGTSLPAEDTGSSSTDNTTSSVPSSGSGSSAVSIAYQYLGVPYVYGGASPSGFDCSGFVYYVYGTFGISVGRTPAAQASAGTQVDKASLQVGDIVLFAGTGGSGITHAGIYAGNGQFSHSPNSRSTVSYSDLNSGYWSEHFYCGIRVV